MHPHDQHKIFEKLRKELLVLESNSFQSCNEGIQVPFLSKDFSFSNGNFLPIGIHEFLNTEKEDVSATIGFISSLLSSKMQNGGICIWIRQSGAVFPGGLPAFGLHPENVIFIDLKNEKQALWVMEEALKCEKLCAVIAEIKNIDLTSSRRLQLAVEHSRIYGFIVRYAMHKLHPIASVSKWQITSLSSLTEDEMPGVGYPRWHVELLKMRNGITGSWNIEFTGGELKESNHLNVNPQLQKAV